MNSSEYSPAGEATFGAGEPGRPSVFLMIDKLETGGSERQFVFAARALRSANYEVDLGCMRHAGPFLEGLGNVVEFNVGGSFFARRAPRAYWNLAQHLRARRVAIAHSFDFYSNLMMIPIAKASGIPVVIGSQRQIGDLLTPRQFWAQVTCFRLCDRVVCNSRAAASRLLAHGLPQRRLAVIGNGLPDEAFAQAEPVLPRLPNMVRAGMIARMNHPVKNHSAFLRAAAEVARRHPTVEFLLAGDGPLRPELERLVVQLGLEGRVLFLGERRDIPAVLAALDILVVPSSSESLSNVILEAMAAGVAVVATGVGGTPELVLEGETGLLVPAGSDEALAAAMERFLTQPSLRLHCSARARDFARTHFACQYARDQYCRLYDTLLEEKGWIKAQGSIAKRTSSCSHPEHLGTER
jgi:glycosyltransferase involved in cell wall biosynthesis